MREKQKESNFEHVMKVQAMGEKKDRENVSVGKREQERWKEEEGDQVHTDWHYITSGWHVSQCDNDLGNQLHSIVTFSARS